jgi:hypothetical protein
VASFGFEWFISETNLQRAIGRSQSKNWFKIEPILLRNQPDEKREWR